MNDNGFRMIQAHCIYYALYFYYYYTKTSLDDFKNNFQGTFLGLIVLPQNLFNANHIGKSILVGCGKKINNFEMMIMQLSDLNNKEKFMNDIKEIQEWIIKIKEIEK